MSDIQTAKSEQLLQFIPDGGGYKLDSWGYIKLERAGMTRDEVHQAADLLEEQGRIECRGDLEGVVLYGRDATGTA